MINLQTENLNLHFSDVFGVTEEALEEYGAFNTSLVTDPSCKAKLDLLWNPGVPDEFDFEDIRGLDHANQLSP